MSIIYIRNDDTGKFEPIPAIKGEKGDSYILTNDDKQEIAAAVSANGLTNAQITALNSMFRVAAYIKADISAEYEAFITAFGLSGSGEEPGEPNVPDEPGTPETGLSNETTWSNGIAYEYASVENEYVNKTNGAMVSYNGWCRTPYMYCAGASKIRIETAVVNETILGNNETYNAFYDENGNFIQNFGFSDLDNSTVGSYVEIDVPTNAVYFVISHKHAVICDNIYNRAYISIIPYE